MHGNATDDLAGGEAWTRMGGDRRWWMLWRRRRQRRGDDGGHSGTVADTSAATAPAADASSTLVESAVPEAAATDAAAPSAANTCAVPSGPSTADGDPRRGGEEAEGIGAAGEGLELPSAVAQQFRKVLRRVVSGVATDASVAGRGDGESGADPGESAEARRGHTPEETGADAAQIGSLRCRADADLVSAHPLHCGVPLHIVPRGNGPNTWLCQRGRSRTRLRDRPVTALQHPPPACVHSPAPLWRTGSMAPMCLRRMHGRQASAPV